MEDSTREVQRQYSRGEGRRGHRCTHKGRLFDSCRNGKYIPVQTNREITGEVLIKISDKTILVLVRSEIIYNIKKKLGCIYVENHNSEPMVLKRRQTVGLVTSCVVTKEEQGQTPVDGSDATQHVMGTHRH